LKCIPASCLIAHDEGMNEGKSIFSQLIDFLPDREFRRCVARYGGDRYTKTLSCWEQFLAMAFAQLAYRESLRDKLNDLAASGAVSLKTRFDFTPQAAGYLKTA